MPRNNTYRHYDLSFPKNTKKVLNVSKFMGVDYGVAQLQVADYHAVDILNIVFKDRVNQKRHGWQQLFEMGNTTYYIENTDGMCNYIMEYVMGKLTEQISPEIANMHITRAEQYFNGLKPNNSNLTQHSVKSVYKVGE